MVIKEEVRNLFEVPQGYYLVQCISADFALGAGIALQFNEIYNMREKLKAIYEGEDVEVGSTLLVDNVFNLVTKEKGYGKPTYDTLKDALYDMKKYMNEFLITKIAMPHIASGLDRLEWNQVREIIEDTFADTDCEILICTI